MSVKSARLCQIGEAAERVGLSLRTVRHWEEMGLVTPTTRSPGGFRLYGEGDLERLRVVMLMKPLGLTLDEMRELLELVQAAGDLPAGASAPDQIADRLATYEERTRERIAKIERDLAQAKRLGVTIRAHIRTLTATPVPSSEPGRS